MKKNNEHEKLLDITSHHINQLGIELNNLAANYLKSLPKNINERILQIIFNNANIYSLMIGNIYPDVNNSRLKAKAFSYS